MNAEIGGPSANVSGAGMAVAVTVASAPSVSI
jgi:hypothetical protein